MTEAMRTKFREYDRRNPEVYREFKLLAYELVEAGREKYGAWAIMNTIRWNHDIRTSGDVFKIRNDFISLYARKLAKEDPAFKTFFTFKRLK